LLLAPGTRLGPYGIVAPLGSGRVYRASDLHSGRTVAIRLLDLGAGAELPQALIDDARAAAALDHPHIAKAYGLEQADGRVFVVEEFVEGQSLHSLSRLGLPFERVLAYGRQIAAAVALAHRQDLVHGDLRTSSVIVTPAGDVRVVGFGTAAAMRRVDLQALHYMAPERLRGDSASKVSDVWALGVLFWDMTVAEFPFTGTTATTIQSAIMFSSLVSPPLAWPDSFMAVVFRCLSKGQDLRYRDAAGVSTALKAIPLTPREHAWARVRPVAFGAAAVVAFVAVALPTYQYLIASREKRPTAAVSEPIASAPAPVRSTTLAILPFTSADAATRDIALEVGLADAMITGVGALPGMTVRPITAVLEYATRVPDPFAIGKALRVDSVLQGTVHTVEGKVQASARLVSVADRKVLWDDRFESDSTGSSAVQHAVMRRVAGSLAPHLPRDTFDNQSRHSTLNPDAHRAYLEGRYYWSQQTESGLRKAIAQFERAAALDPAYALAHAGIADAQTSLGLRGFGRVADTIERARGAALQAVIADDALPEAHASLALVRWVYDWNWEQAETEFKRVLDLNPGHTSTRRWYAYFLASRGRSAEALAQIERARDLDPTSLHIRSDVGAIHAWARQPDAAIAELQAIVARDPSLGEAQYHLGLAYLLQPRVADGISALERARELEPEPRTIATLGYAHGLAGNRVHANALLDELTALAKRRHVSPFAFAQIHTGLGNRDQAFRWLDRALHERSDAMAVIGAYPWIDQLRADERFERLVIRAEANRYH
jgi:eukaryotic-like serine/threonine-protein kinase